MNKILIIEIFRIINKSLHMFVGEIIINKMHVIMLMAIIFMYSAIKINAKVPELYSVLNPDTSSDSPSARSKGVRLVSAKEVINQEIDKGHNIRINIIE